MSLYSENLKNEIKNTLSRIKRINQNIKVLTNELITRDNVYNRAAHIRVLNTLKNARSALITRLEELKNQVH